MKKELKAENKVNQLYHDTYLLLRKYRDVVWSLELSVQQVRRQFQVEYGSSIEDFWSQSISREWIFQTQILRNMPEALNGAIRCLN